MTNFDDCVDAETLGAFVEGSLDPQGVRRVLSHLDRCEVCMAAVDAAAETVREESPVRRVENRRWLYALAAMLALAVVGLAVFRTTRATDPMSRLVSAMPENVRPVEPRLTGGFHWAEYRGPVRSGQSDVTDPQQLKLHGAAGEVLEKSGKDKSAASQHAAAVAMLLVDDSMKAIDKLRPLAEQSHDAGLWSDLSAAYYAAAARLGRASLYPSALAAADQALRLEPRRTEALFNRALTLERMGLQHEARKAWEQYLAVDASSAWSNEARKHLATLRATTDYSLFKKALPQFEQAVHTSNAKAIASFVDRYPQQIRAYAEVEHLREWAEALQKGDRKTAAERLSIARAVGDALVTTSGETLLRDAVRVIDSADDTGRAQLAVAHIVYRDGRMAYSKRMIAPAAQSLADAAQRFERAGSPMALSARYFLANAHFDENDIDAARGELEALRDSAPPSYAALRAQVAWELGLCFMSTGDWGSALSVLSDAEKNFTRLRETSNAAFIQTLLADTLAYLGRDDEAWAARVRSFDALSGQGFGVRRLISLASATRMELFAGRSHEALSLMQLEIAEAKSVDDPTLLSDALVRRTMLNSQLQRDSDAAADLASAKAVVGKVSGDLRERLDADIAFARGTYLLAHDARGAHEALTSAIARYETLQRPIFLPEALLQRARASEKLAKSADALNDLEAGIRALEAQQNNVEMTVGTGILNAGSALFEEAIRISLATNDEPRAFEFAERSRVRLGGDAVSVRALQERLRDTGAVVLEYAVLPNETIAFCVSEAGLRVMRVGATRAQLAAFANAVWSQDGADAALARLNELLIHPFDESLRGARDIFIVPDPLLQSVPYAALVDRRSNRRLIERASVVLAPAASTLQVAERTPATTRSVLAVNLPSGEQTQLAGLPETESELREVVSMYSRASLLEPAQATFRAFVDAAALANVIHVAGHSVSVPGTIADAGLVFAGAREPVSWRAIARERLPRRVVVLAACESLRAPARSLSLGGGFLAAGAPYVVGTLVPIEDGYARQLFREVHRHLALGESPVDAVRRTQLDALSRGERGWQAVSLLAREIPRT